MSQEPTRNEGTGGRTGDPRPVAPSLIYKIAEHSPELVVELRHYLQSRGEELVQRTTYDGTDPSAKLSLILLEALLCFEQLHMEILEQTAPDPSRIVPAHYILAMNEVLRMEPILLHAAKLSLQTHLYIWNAHEGSVRVEPKKKKGKRRSEDTEEPRLEDRGRWGTSK